VTRCKEEKIKKNAKTSSCPILTLSKQFASSLAAMSKISIKTSLRTRFNPLNQSMSHDEQLENQLASRTNPSLCIIIMAAVNLDDAYVYLKSFNIPPSLPILSLSYDDLIIRGADTQFSKTTHTFLQVKAILSLST
jgi:hypothetical protein